MKKRLEDEIEFIREEMMDVAGREGLSADKTMRLSKKLDTLINRFEAQKEGCSYCTNDVEIVSSPSLPTNKIGWRNTNGYDTELQK